MEEQDFEILRDKHVGTNAEDLFGYNDIAENLLTIINKVEPPFTIGLYGQWGLGKSSVCNLVQASLEDDPNYEVFYFDTWKYERDSFRRQFLIELDHDVFKGKLEYRDALNQSLTVPSQLPFFESIKESADYLIRKIFTATFLPTILGLLGLTFVYAVNTYIWNFLTDDIFLLIQDGINGLIVLGSLIFIGKFIIESSKVIEAQVTIPRTDSAEGFEHFYGLALEKLDKKKKLLVIIDNLDRLDHANGVALLSDIKTFLANDKLNRKTKNKTIFLIPCDDSALADQLRGVYKDKIDADEFLRKFFNVSVRLPRLLDSSLDNFIEKKLKTTRIPEFQVNHSLVFVVGRAFKNNPREIIQFINTLTGTYFLAKKRGLDFILEKQNLPFLAKVLAVRVKWSSLYKTIEDKVVRTSETLVSAAQQLPSSEDTKKEKTGLDEFLKATMDIRDDENGDEVYFSLYQSPEQRQLPEWPAFISAAVDYRKADLRKIYSSIKESEEKKSALTNLLREYYNRNSSRDDSITNILRSLHEILTDENLEVFEPFFARAFANVTSLEKHFKSIPFDKILTDRFNDLETQSKRNIAEGLIKVLAIVGAANEDDWAMLDQSIILLNLLSQKNKEQSLRSFYAAIIEVKTKILSTVDINQLGVDRGEAADYVKSFTSLLSPQSPVDKSMTFPGLYQLFMLAQHSSFTDKSVIEEVMLAADSFLGTVGIPAPVNEDDKSKLSQFTSQAVVHYNNTDDWTSLRRITARVLLKVWSRENPQQGIVESSLTDFISNPRNTVENIVETFGKAALPDILQRKDSMRASLATRTGYDPELFITLGLQPAGLKGPEIGGALRNLVHSNREKFIPFLKYLKYSVPQPERSSLVMTMIGVLEALSVEQLNEWLLAIAKLDVAEGEKEAFGERLRAISSRGDEARGVIKKFVAKHKSLVNDDTLKTIQSS